MKFQKVLMLLAAVTLVNIPVFSGTGTVQASTVKHYVNWKMNPKINTYPKNMRGVWYTYNKYNGLREIHIYKNKITFSISKKHKDVPSHGSNYLYKYVKHSTDKPSQKESKEKTDWHYVSSTFDTQLNSIKRHWIDVYG